MPQLGAESLLRLHCRILHTCHKGTQARTTNGLVQRHVIPMKNELRMPIDVVIVVSIKFYFRDVDSRPKQFQMLTHFLWLVFAV